MDVKKIVRKAIKAFFGVAGISLFVKKQKKAVLRRVYTKKYSADDLVAEMCKMGMQRGSVVFIHSSMTEFYNYTGTAIELINKIIQVIDEDGTLMMPAYPRMKMQLLKDALNPNEVVFDVNNTPSGAGYLSEVFRTYPGVKRSISLQHSVCAFGKLAEYMTSEHHLSVTAWDEMSPYYKMSQINTLVFAFGLPNFLGTVIHCTESILRNKYQYFSLFFTKKNSYTYRDENGNVGVHTFLTHDFIRKSSKKKIIKKYFDKNQFHVKYISNLRIQMVNAKYTLELYLKLAEKGITMYSKPSPVKFIKNGHFIEINETNS